MSLPPPSLDAVPAETSRIARAAFPKGSLAMTLRDRLAAIYHDGMFADLYPPEGQPACAPWRLALVTILQYAEHLTDRQAATAVRARIDWKYALALPIDHPGFDHSVLSTFRDRLIAGQAEERLLWAVLEACGEQGLLARRGRQRTDSTHVLAAVRRLNRLELVGETLRNALEALAVAAPDWLGAHVPAAWADRYARRIEEYRLPQRETARGALAQQIGQDGQHLLTALGGPDAPAWLGTLPAIRTLAIIWAQQYEQRQDGLRFRPTADLPPATTLRASPVDEDARWGKKRQVGWVGYKAHLTEQCEPGLPHLITAIATTPAPVADQGMVEAIWDDLADRGLLPDEHLVDRGYTDAPGLVRAQERQIDLVGPVQSNTGWQAQAATGYDVAHFRIDWAAEQVTCPAGKRSSSWYDGTTERGTPIIRVAFREADCQACPAHAACTRGARRTLTLLPQDQHEARQAALARQQTEAFRAQYRQRAGIEGTISQAVRTTGLRQARYRGLPKVHLQHCAEAAALNILRLDDYFADRPRAGTRRSRFAQVLAAA